MLTKVNSRHPGEKQYTLARETLQRIALSMENLKLRMAFDVNRPENIDREWDKTEN